MKQTELLCPAGTLKNMRYAYAYGADAVYAGQPRYSLRVRNNDFLYDNLVTGINEAHQAGKKFFIASNLLPHNAKVKTYLKDIQPIIALNPDALIMADPGLIMMVRENWPDMTIHLSVQANTLNYASVKFWQSIGIKRIILSRELSLEEIEEIRQQCPDIELEVFVHGALCIAYSGRCLLSGYFNHRDPNQGTCTNSCRWKYDVHETKQDDCGNVVKAETVETYTPELAPSNEENLVDNLEKEWLLEEKGRPGEYLPISEDEHGTYIMNSKDLRAIQHVKKLVDIGIDSLKIEGRTKSHYYVARTARIYRQAIDDVANGIEFNQQYLRDLENLSNRGYTEGFYRRHVPQETQNYSTGVSTTFSQKYVAEVMRWNDETQCAEVLVKNKFSVGDTLEVIQPDKSFQIILKSMTDLKGNDMQVLQEIQIRQLAIILLKEEIPN
ncbi:MAG: tRNA 5-hydroxyuridine modification protein YegQ [Methylococcales bacterium]|nr:tRNA 5-hydroxyuridine modification protein YegQ [Methylococcales bacterium]